MLILFGLSVLVFLLVWVAAAWRDVLRPWLRARRRRDCNVLELPRRRF